LGLVHAAVVTTTALVLLRSIRDRVGPVAIGGAVLRDLAAGGVAGAAAWIVADGIGVGSRLAAGVGLALGGAVGLAVYVAVQAVVGREELRSLRQPRSVLR